MQSPSSTILAPGSAIDAPIARQGYVDAFRGLLIAHMALDHASLMFNAGRAGEELAAAAAPVTGDLLQFLTRFTGVPVAPAFFFMAKALRSRSRRAPMRRWRKRSKATSILWSRTSACPGWMGSN